jgi:pyruvate/2-oxoglutarate dehydrogenase complex dihydrolipoamide dehydrogenase (E3) component
LATGAGSRSLYAIGDCNGSGLASEAQQQGRQVAESLFGGEARGEEGEYEGNSDGEGAGEGVDEEEDSMIEADPFFSASSGVNESDEPYSSTSTLFGGASADTPLTLWTIPEIASVGLTSEQAKAKYPSDAIVVGYGYFKDMARGRLNGDMEGYLKVVARKSRHKHNILGVQIMGDGANELIQLGSILVHSSATLEQVSRTPFAAVTLSALLQMACDDALLNIRSNKM